MASNYSKIIDIIEPGAKVLDVGCGTGALLQELIEHKNVLGRGVEIDEANILECIKKNVPVNQLDIDEGLVGYLDHSYDYVILSQTLQVVHRPLSVLREMLRVGRKGIVTIPNFGHWGMRLNMLFHGKMPKSRILPYEWYNTPNIHVGTILDFKDLCSSNDIRILNEYSPDSRMTEIAFLRPFFNILASEGLFVIAKGEQYHHINPD